MRQQPCDTINLKKIKLDPVISAGLKRLLKRQLELCDKLDVSKGTDICQTVKSNLDKRKAWWLNHLVDCLHAELEEVRELLPWKSWKNYDSWTLSKVRGELRYELVDLLHFWLEMCLILGLDSKEVTKLYSSKLQQNKNRQQQGY